MKNKCLLLFIYPKEVSDANLIIQRVKGAARPIPTAQPNAPINSDQSFRPVKP